MADTANSATNLVHGSFLCPGLHGAGAARQDIQRRSFAELLGSSKSFEIPIFQRVYCWPQRLAESWWRDLWSGTRCPIGGQHSTGKILLFPTASNGNNLIVIDGQQRLVTSCLCIAALRDRALLEIGATQGTDTKIRSQLTELVACLERLLFRDILAADEWCKAASSSLERAESQDSIWDELLPEGTCPAFFSLTPSYYDRAVFARLLLERRFAAPFSAPPSNNPKPAEVNKVWFDGAIAKLCRNLKGDALVSTLRRTARGAIELMGVMAITVIDPPLGLAQQVFLWYQEQTLLGQGALLFNPCPGITFNACDLVRNLVLAPLISLGPEHMDYIMRQHWLPLERRFDSSAQFDAFLARFVRQPPTAPPSPAVKDLMEYLKACSGKDGLDGIRLYVQFVTTYDHILHSFSADLREGSTSDVTLDCISDLEGESRLAYCRTLHAIGALRMFADSEASTLGQGSPQQCCSGYPQKKRLRSIEALIQKVAEASLNHNS